MTRIAICAGAMALCLAFAGLARAGIITYTEQATATGTLGTSSFTDALLTLAYVGNTADVAHTGTIYYYPLAGGTVTVAGVGTAAFTEWVSVFVDQVNSPGPPGKIAFGTSHGTILATINPAFASYDLTTAFPPISGFAYGNPTAFPVTTTLGDLSFSVSGSPTFSAAETVPEPASLTLFCIGLASVVARGCAMRRSRSRRAGH